MIMVVDISEICKVVIRPRDGQGRAVAYLKMPSSTNGPTTSLTLNIIV
jgi:hypothetical protein